LSSSTYTSTSDLRFNFDGTIISPTYVGASGYVGVEQVQFKVPQSLSGTPRVANIKIETRSASYPNWVIGNQASNNELPNNGTSGDVKNVLSIPIK
jgi:uncharacterized protein (TIGR03437 family)